MAVVDEIVVFRNPDKSPFSMDPRWHDSRIKEAWIKKYGEEETLSAEQIRKAEAEQVGGKGPAGQEEEPEEVEDEVVPYPQWTNDELRGELDRRNLSLEGKKSELIKRLEKSDAAGWVDPDEDDEDDE